MEKRVYKDTPENLSGIQGYIITDVKAAGEIIIKAEKCYFYDACSFRKHMYLQEESDVIQYIKDTCGIVVIMRCILMELCSSDGRLWKEHIAYVRKLYSANIKILLLYEEDIFDIMGSCFIGNAQINCYLRYAVRTVKSNAGSVERTLNEEPQLCMEVMSDRQNTSPSLYCSFFRAARSRKETGDNLGEELLLICLHILSNIPEKAERKYVLLTEDKGAVTRLIRASNNIRTHLSKETMIALTTPKLAQLLWSEGRLSDAAGIMHILTAGSNDSEIRICCSEKYDLYPELKTLSAVEIAEKLVNRAGLTIFY